MNLKVKAIKKYNDAKIGRMINIGEEFNVTKERAILLLNHHVVEVMDIINNDKKT